MCEIVPNGERQSSEGADHLWTAGGDRAIGAKVKSRDVSGHKNGEIRRGKVMEGFDSKDEELLDQTGHHII